MENKIKGGLGDNMSLEKLSKKHNVSLEFITKQCEKGTKVESEHTKDPKVAREIARDHLTEDPRYYIKLAKIEANEQSSDASGAVEGKLGLSPMEGTPVITRPIGTLPNSKPIEFKEATDSSSSGAYDVPLFGGARGRKNPLAIEGPSSIAKSRAVSDPNFPKFGGPGGVFIKIKDKCKKFPYCNQGDINAIEILHEAINDVAKKYGLSTNQVEKIVLKEIRDIFI